MKIVPTFTATIYVGLEDTDSGSIFPADTLRDICQKYCDEIGLCVTFTQTDYIYTKGSEPGVIIGLINYPRFPAKFSDIKKKALELGKLLLKAANQYKVSVVFPGETIMIEREDL